MKKDQAILVDVMVEWKLCPRCKKIKIQVYRELCEKCFLIDYGISLHNSLYDPDKKPFRFYPIIELKVEPTVEKKGLNQDSIRKQSKILTPEKIEKLRYLL